MKIHFTQKEYRLLLDMLYISDWIMNSRNIDVDELTAPYRQVEQKILAHAKEFGLDNLIAYEPSTQEYCPTQELESDEALTAFIEDFEEDSFWDLLTSRLAQRDLVQKVGMQQYQEMAPIDRMTEEDKLAERYNAEFEAHGVDNLVIKDA